MYYKQLYGYKIESEIDLPYLCDSDGGSYKEIIRISLGKIPQKIENPSFSNKRLQVGNISFRLEIDNVATYFVVKNKDYINITIFPFHNSTDNEVSAFLLGTVMGGLLHMQGELSLHAGAVNIADKTILICGDSGAGKSTLLSELLNRDAKLVTDDISVINYKDDNFFISSGHPNIRLWSDAVKLTDYQCEEKYRIRSTHNKFWIPVSENFVPSSKKISAIYILKNERTAKVEINEVHGIEKIKLFKKYSFKKQFIRYFNRQKTFFNKSVSFANLINIYIVSRPEGNFSNEIANRILTIIHSPSKIEHDKLEVMS